MADRTGASKKNAVMHNTTARTANPMISGRNLGLDDGLTVGMTEDRSGYPRRKFGRVPVFDRRVEKRILT